MNLDTPILPVTVSADAIKECPHDDVNEDAYLVGVYLQAGAPIRFHVFLHRYGAMYYRLEPEDLGIKSRWPCLSSKGQVREIGFLRNQFGVAHWPAQQSVRYLFTLEYEPSGADDYGADYTQVAGEYKCAHFCQTDEGRLLLLPNNCVVWLDDATEKVRRPLSELPRLVANGKEAFHYDL